MVYEIGWVIMENYLILVSSSSENLLSYLLCIGQAALVQRFRIGREWTLLRCGLNGTIVSSALIRRKHRERDWWAVTLRIAGLLNYRPVKIRTYKKIERLTSCLNSRDLTITYPSWIINSELISGREKLCRKDIFQDRLRSGSRDGNCNCFVATTSKNTKESLKKWREGVPTLTIC